MSIAAPSLWLPPSMRRPRHGPWYRLPWRNPIAHLMASIRWIGNQIVWNGNQIVWGCPVPLATCTQCPNGAPGQITVTTSGFPDYACGTYCCETSNGPGGCIVGGFDINGITATLPFTLEASGTCTYDAIVPVTAADDSCHGAVFHRTVTGIQLEVQLIPSSGQARGIVEVLYTDNLSGLPGSGGLWIHLNSIGMVNTDCLTPSTFSISGADIGACFTPLPSGTFSCSIP